MRGEVHICQAVNTANVGGFFFKSFILSVFKADFPPQDSLIPVTHVAFPTFTGNSGSC